MWFSSVFAPRRSASPRRRSTQPKPASNRLTLEVLEDRTVPSGLGVNVVPGDPQDWPMYNHDPAGSRDNFAEHILSPATVGGLQVKWTFPTHGPIAGTPAVVHDRVYAADATGVVYALDRDGHELWETQLTVGPTFSHVKVTASALVTNRTVIIGDLAGQIHGLDVDTGKEIWTVRPNPHPFASIWGSPTMVGNDVAIGTASYEEFIAPFIPNYHPSFRGSVLLLDPATGNVIWQTSTISAEESAAGSAGAAIWSTPTYDQATNTIYVTTGNNYSEPTTVTSDAFMALDAATGAIKWVNQRTHDDVWTFAFGDSSEAHPDFDIGDSPKIYKLGGETVVSAGQKSGFFHVLDAATGAQVNPPIQLAPNGTVGGLFADAAYADGVVYANGTDWPGLLTGQPPNRGILSAVAADGSHELWHFNTPHSPNISGVAVANGVVYFQSMLNGMFYALDAKTGTLLAQVATGGQSSGPAVSRGQIYLGTGDSSFPFLNPTLPLGPGSIEALGIPDNHPDSSALQTLHVQSHALRSGRPSVSTRTALAGVNPLNQSLTQSTAIASTAVSAPTATRNWSVQVGTAAGIPQDIWITAMGNNVDGWHGAGSIALVGPLPEGGVGVRTVFTVDRIEQGGIIGVDGTPVAPGTYTAPGITEPTIQFNVVAGQTFYVIFDDHIVNTDFPGFHVGQKFRAMFTFNTVLGHTDQNLINWVDFGQGLQPFLNEGTMMTNIHQQP
jgi:polyvinyl alcohol dehydrogenase (cytochrome)